MATNQEPGVLPTTNAFDKKRVFERMGGGEGASDYMLKVAGDINSQVAGNDGSLKYTPISGGGLEQVAVPAVLFLANNMVPKWMSRKTGGSKMEPNGGGIMKRAMVPVTMLLSKNVFNNKSMRKMPFLSTKSKRRTKGRKGNKRSGKSRR